MNCRSLILFAALSFLPLASCATARSAQTAAAEVLISDQQEEELGLQVRKELEAKGVRYLQDPQIVSYVQSVSRPILQAASQERKGVEWKVSVIDDPKTVNAFATPGGYLYVYTGLLLTAANEAELAGVLAHEAGHVVARHSARQLVSALGLQTVLSMALGENPNTLAQVAGSLLGQGTLLANSRSDETEADELGARFSSATGYDPMGLVNFFHLLEASEGKTPKILTWLSTHPTTPDRIRHHEKYIQEHHLTGSKVQTPAFQAAKERLQQLPAGTSAPAPSTPSTPSERPRPPTTAPATPNERPRPPPHS